MRNGVGAIRPRRPPCSLSDPSAAGRSARARRRRTPVVASVSMADERAGTLTAARTGDEAAFQALVAPHLRELHVHCYRMLGSLDVSDDALQEVLVAAWQGLDGFAG